MFRKLHLGDVSLNLSDTWQRGHCLKVNCHNLDLFTLVFSTEIRKKKKLKCNYNKKHFTEQHLYVLYTLYHAVQIKCIVHLTNRSLRLRT